MICTLEDFIREYTNIKSQGWIRTHRAGPTGIGKTLEDLLGIEENNYDAPDFGEYELKSCRKNSKSMLTIFTRAPSRRGANTELRNKYGYSSNAYNNDEKVLHATLNAIDFTSISDTGHKLKLTFNNQRIYFESETGIEDNIYYDLEDLRQSFEKKYKGKLVYAKAQSRGQGADEEFLFDEAYEVEGFNYDAMISLLEEGRIYLDLRIGQYSNGKTHDHGSGFRIRESDHSLLFKKNKRIV